MIDEFKTVAFELITTLKVPEPLIVIKKTMGQDKFGQIKENYNYDNEIKFNGVVIKPKEKELLDAGFNIQDKANYLKIYTLFSNINENDLIKIKDKLFIVDTNNNHFERYLNYIVFYIYEKEF